MGEGTGVGWRVIAVASLTFPFKKCFIRMFRFKPRILSSQENHTPPFHHELHPTLKHGIEITSEREGIFYLHVVIYQKVLLTSWYGRYSASCSIALGGILSINSITRLLEIASSWKCHALMVIHRGHPCMEQCQRTGERMLHPGRLTWNL